MENYGTFMTKGGTFFVLRTHPKNRRRRRRAAIGRSPLPRHGGYRGGLLAGLLHDMGKCTAPFQDYLEAAFAGKNVRRGSVNHTFAGVRFLWERWHTDANPPMRRAAAELAAFAAGAHHALFDCIAPDGADGYAHRLEPLAEYADARAAFLRCCADEEALDALCVRAEAETKAVLDRCFTMAGALEGNARQTAFAFYASLLARLLLSAVIEGDRLDTASFMLGPPAEPPAYDWRTLLASVEAKLQALPADTEIDRARRAISDAARASARRETGIYRLDVPTGGGKTLTALRFALAHAAEKEKKRIFFVIPYLSILEQNAARIREYLQNDALVLEHHSNVVREAANGEALDDNELLADSWRAPVVITTLVQLLNTFFDGRTSCIRRMQALCGSVLVIDEVQSAPRSLLSLMNLTLNFLSEVCGATVVLCSATQPHLEKLRYPLRFAADADLVPCDGALWERFRRTELIDKRRSGGYDTAELAALAAETARKAGSLLLVCNTRAQARTLYAALGAVWSGKRRHLSTSMCTKHRKAVLEDVCAALNAREPLICVTTQLIEAGVDVSFGSVIRILAGMDNAVQAAGRCNRSGEYGELRPVLLVNYRGENLSRLPEIYHAQQVCEDLLLRFERDPAAFDGRPDSESALNVYYTLLYKNANTDASEGPLSKGEPTLLELLSVNKGGTAKCSSAAQYTFRQAFRTAGDEFRVFDDHTQDVLVPYDGDGRALIDALGSEKARHDLAYRRSLLRQAAAYSISLYDYEVRALCEAGGLRNVTPDGAVRALSGHYDEETGFFTESKPEFWNI